MKTRVEVYMLYNPYLSSQELSKVYSSKEEAEKRAQSKGNDLAMSGYPTSEIEIISSTIDIEVNPEELLYKQKIQDYIDGGSIGDLDLRYQGITDLKNLQSVGGYLNLYGTPITSLGNLQSVDGYLNLSWSEIESLGNLQSVGGGLYMRGTPITSLGNLKYVDGDLDLRRTPISKKYSEEEIRQMVDVKGKIYL